MVTPGLEEIFHKALQALEGGAPVLLLGEVGAGKSWTAKELHRLAGDGPFVRVGCASANPALLEAELFGTARGAFTGAVSRPGLIEAADGGTLFLDEVVELPPQTQAKLLHVLEEGEFRRLGEAASRKSSFRLVSAANGGLERLRPDLLDRLGIAVEVPPLRERPEDVVPLLEEFTGGELPLGEEGKDFLRSLGWPGNVRQLRKFSGLLRTEIARKTDVTLGLLKRIYQDTLPLPAGGRGEEGRFWSAVRSAYLASGGHPDEWEDFRRLHGAYLKLKATEAACIGARRLCRGRKKKLSPQEALREVRKWGSVKEAARRLGVHPSTVYRKLKSSPPARI